jgi:preprotein translocase subunit SecD
VPPPSTTNSRPGRLLVALAVLIIVMLAGVIGSNIGNPGHWHKSFKVGLGLDLSWGTQITLKAVPPKGQTTVDQGAMNKAKSIMLDRINGSGFTGASVVQQGSDDIVVSVPHKNAKQVGDLVGATAQLAFRQVLLESTNTVTSTATPSATPSAKASSSPSASASPKASPTPTTSGGSGQAAGAKPLAASSPKAKASPSASSTPSPSAPASPSPAASASAGPPRPATTADGAGDASKLSAQTAADFNRLNCADKNWQVKIYGANPNGWGREHEQAVGCQKILDANNKWTGQWDKVAMAAPVILGTDLSGVSAQVNPNGAGYIVSFNVKTGPASRLGKLTQTMAGYYNAQSTDTTGADAVLSQLAVVLDGQVQEAPQVQGQITTNGEINGGGTGGFTQGQASQLANILKYGQLPLTFHAQNTSAVSPELGSAQLSAGIIAGIIGLILVVVYSFIYYRALAIVSVSSLAIAAILTYLAVVLLSAHEGFNLTLAGIAGLIVAIGITADSFIVYFERLRDEVREGRSLRAAVERGWARARRTILVSDTVSFLAALLLYIFAIGDVRGFAFTLGLTTLIDILVVFLFTKPMVTLLARTRFFGQGHKMSGLDPERLGARAPWRGSRRPPAAPAGSAPATPKEA